MSPWVPLGPSCVRIDGPVRAIVKWGVSGRWNFNCPSSLASRSLMAVVWRARLAGGLTCPNRILLKSESSVLVLPPRAGHYVLGSSCRSTSFRRFSRFWEPLTAATGPQILRCRTCKAVCPCIKEMPSSRVRPGAWKLIRFPSMKSPRTAILSTHLAYGAIPIRRPEIFLRRAVALPSIQQRFRPRPRSSRQQWGVLAAANRTPTFSPIWC
jgi:hypothetical protein